MRIHLAEIIEDISDRLDWGDGTECVDPKTQKKIVRAIKRLFDRWSIDGRMIPMIQQVEQRLDVDCNRVAIGSEGDFFSKEAPHTIVHAEWAYRLPCGCTHRSCCDSHISSFEQGIDIVENPENFHQLNPERDVYGGLPTQLWYQQSFPNGEIVFNSIPPKGAVLVLRVEMPFCIDLSDCACPVGTKEPEWEFVVKSTYPISPEVRKSVLHEAGTLFDGCDRDFQLITHAEPLGCQKETKVCVTVRRNAKLSHGCVVNGEIDLPPGYYDAITTIASYDLMPNAGITRTSIDLQEKNRAVKLLQRQNARPHVTPADKTTYWNAHAQY